MENGKMYVAALLAAAISFVSAPEAVSALSPEASEYLVRLATGTLYVHYTELYEDKQYSSEAESVWESSDVSAEESVAEESSDGTAVSTPPPEGAIAVGAINLSRLEVDDAPALLLINETDYKADLDALAKRQINIKGGSVLIIHTHGTEAYLPDGRDYYTEEDEFRSTDCSKNVVAVGEVFAEVLRENGITVYHDRTLFDEHAFNSAYASSRAACRQWLADHSDIAYIIDIHRDAVTDGKGARMKTMCTVDGKEMAQVMLVMGTDEAGASHPDWEDNLSLAARYQSSLCSKRTFARPIYLRSASYNQQLTRGSMLIEVGSDANTISEAKDAARLAARLFAELYGDINGISKA